MKLLKLVSLMPIAALLIGCQSTAIAPLTDGSLRDPRVSGVIVIRSYGDEFKIDGHDVPVFVQYAWDYTRGVATERITTPKGELISATDQPDLTLNLTDAERAYAFELAGQHPKLKAQFAQAGHVYGGFSFRESDDPACFRGSRCVHVVASTSDGYRKLAHAIVDLQAGIVVHTHYEPKQIKPLTGSELTSKGS